VLFSLRMDLQFRLHHLAIYVDWQTSLWAVGFIFVIDLVQPLYVHGPNIDHTSSDSSSIPAAAILDTAVHMPGARE